MEITQIKQINASVNNKEEFFGTHLYSGYHINHPHC